MVKTAKANVVSPTVTAKDPDGLLIEQIGIFNYLASESASFAWALLAVLNPFGFTLGACQVNVNAVAARCKQFFRSCRAFLRVFLNFKPLKAAAFNSSVVINSCKLLNLLCKSFTAVTLCDVS